MSTFWDMKFRKDKKHVPFKDKMGQSWSPFWKMKFKWYPTPGCISHDHPRSERVFERRVGLKSNKANLVYWRMHPQEWEQVRGEYGQKHL